MYRALIIILVTLGAAACGKAKGLSTPLQQYDQLGWHLRVITRSSETVAVDAQRMNADLQREYVRASRNQAELLNRDAATLCRQAGGAGNAVRRLEGREKQWRVRYYFALIVHALAWQWRECSALRQLTEVVRTDPLASTTSSAARFVRVSRQSRTAAFLAQKFALRAAAWQRLHAPDFRYSVER